MKKKQIRYIRSTGVPLPHENVDTDQIVPARFLKATSRTGFGKHLFYDQRFDEEGRERDFVLNNAMYGGEILIAGKNFGSGSSREHAAWALVDYGFSAVISSFFADIFKNNALNNSLLPVQVSEDFLQHLLEVVKSEPKTVIEIDLESQVVRVVGMDMEQGFEINAYKKVCLMEGYDDVDYLLSKGKDVEEFEKGRKDDFSIV